MDWMLQAAQPVESSSTNIPAWVPPNYSELRVWWDFASPTNTLRNYTNSASPPTYKETINWDLTAGTTTTNPTYVAPSGGKYGYLSFDGGDLAQCTFKTTTNADIDVFGPTNFAGLHGARTFSCWLRIRTTGNLLYYYSDFNQQNSANFMRFRYGGTYSDASWNAQSLGIIGTYQYCNITNSVTSYGTNRWIHVVWSSPPILNQYMRMYTNGVLSEVNKGSTNGLYLAANKNFVLGGRPDNAFSWVGDIAQVMVWATNLTAGQIAEVYTNQLAGF
jgi:hypothetical protein